MKYWVNIEYQRSTSTDNFHTKLEVEAGSDFEARKKARAKFKQDYRRRNSKILKATIVGPSPAPVRKAKPEVESSELVIGKRYKTHKGEGFFIRSEFSTSRNRPMFVVENERGQLGIRNERQLRAMIAPPITVSYIAVYPDGSVYTNDRPIYSSQHGLDQLVQVKVTKRNGRIIDKELLS